MVPAAMGFGRGAWRGMLLWLVFTIAVDSSYNSQAIIAGYRLNDQGILLGIAAFGLLGGLLGLIRPASRSARAAGAPPRID